MKGKQKDGITNPLAGKEDDDTQKNPEFNDPESKIDFKTAEAKREEVLWVSEHHFTFILQE